MVRYKSTSKCLGVTLGKALSCKQYLLRIRNNTIQKLCGTTWGSTSTTLRCSALALVYSAGKYCATMWLNSAVTSKFCATSRTATSKCLPENLPEDRDQQILLYPTNVYKLFYANTAIIIKGLRITFINYIAIEYKLRKIE